MTNNYVSVYFTRVDKRAQVPTYAHEGDACMDLRILLAEGVNSVLIKPNESMIFDTGLAFDIPEGYEMKVYPRSGLGIKSHVILSNLVGVIDSNFTDTVKVSLTNRGTENFKVENNMRVAQFQVKPVPKMILVEKDDIGDKGRGEGLGSSGVN